MKAFTNSLLLLSIIVYAGNALAGACVYIKTRSTRGIVACKDNVRNKKACKNLSATDDYKFFSKKKCKQLNWKNSSTSKISAPNLHTALKQVYRQGKAYTSVSFSAEDIFSYNQPLMGTKFLLEGGAEIKLWRKRNSRNILFKSVDSHLSTYNVIPGEVNSTVRSYLHELFPSLEFRGFSFSGEIIPQEQRGAYRVLMTSIKKFQFGHREGDQGSIVSLSNAYISPGSEKFFLIGTGITYHPIMEKLLAFQ